MILALLAYFCCQCSAKILEKVTGVVNIHFKLSDCSKVNFTLHIAMYDVYIFGINGKYI